MSRRNDKNNHDEVVVEEEIVTDDAELESATSEASYMQKIKKLREKLEIKEEEKRALHEELQRARADFLNSKRRLEEQSALDKDRATHKLIIELLSLADTFDIAISNTEVWNSVDETWRLGIEAIHSKLKSILSQHGVEELQPLGEHFNPQEHEAISSIVVNDKQQIDTVLEVLQKGYKKNNTIIRPARVVVGTN